MFQTIGPALIMRAANCSKLPLPHRSGEGADGPNGLAPPGTWHMQLTPTSPSCNSSYFITKQAIPPRRGRVQTGDLSATFSVLAAAAVTAFSGAQMGSQCAEAREYLLTI